MAGSKTPKKPTPERLRRRALHYLGRFAASRAHLRQVLLRRASRDAQHFQIEIGMIEQWVDTMLNDFERVGIINDELFARQVFNRLIEKGTSPRVAAEKLGQKGVARDQIDALINACDAATDFDAAIVLAQKKHLGPWRKGPASREITRKELSVFARAGFSYAIAKKIMDLDEAVSNL